jgi:hypothetical protein
MIAECEIIEGSINEMIAAFQQPVIIDGVTDSVVIFFLRNGYGIISGYTGKPGLTDGLIVHG